MQEKQEKKLTVKAGAQFVSAMYMLTGMYAASRYSLQFGCTTRQSMSIRYIGGLVVAVALVVAIRRSLRPIRSANWVLQAKASFALAGVTLGLFMGTKLLGVGLATAINYSWPALSVVIGWMSWLGFEEKPNFRSVLTVIVTLGGVWALCIQIRATHGDAVNLLPGIACVLGGAVCNAYRINVTPRIAKFDPDLLTGLIWMMLVGAIGMSVVNVCVYIAPGPAPAWPTFTLASVVAMSTIAVFGVTSLHVTIIAQSKAPTSSLTSLASIFQLPFALGVGHFVFDEPWPTSAQMLSMAVIAVGGLLNYLPMPESKNSGQAP